MLIADSILLQRQTRTEARTLTPPHDILTESFLVCDRPLGSERLSSLKLALSGTDFRGVPNTLNQKVTLNATGNQALFLTGPNSAPAVPASPKEIKLNLAATVPVPCDDDRLQKLAATAVGKASTDTAKVQKLLQFVSEFITDDDRVKALSVFEILQHPRGDCTAHALLFTCLARAAGIPCREASGYMYLGDEQQKFGGHAWNEVVIDGVWHPVDPTWNQFNLDPTHIQLSTGHPTPRDARFFNGKITISLH
jgi:transglutaminase-like putative cysteine protease